MNQKQRRDKFNMFLAAEVEANKETCIWMSFCDPDKPEGQQFLGVIITKALGFAHAVEKAHELGINPGGEIQSMEFDPAEVNPKDFDRLLSEADLRAAVYID